MSNNFIGKEMAICNICGKKHMTGILIDTMLRDKFPIGKESVTTHYELCNDHKELYNKEYIALIGVDREMSNVEDEDVTIKNEDAFRTGNIAHIKFSKFKYITGLDLPRDKENNVLEMIFVEDELISKLNEFKNHLIDSEKKEAEEISPIMN